MRLLSGQSDQKRFVGGFLREWVRAPLRVGAVAPSSSSLVRAITQGLGPHSGTVLELGPGTGVFTRCLIDRGISPADITAIEISEAFAGRLKRNLPGVNVKTGSATRARVLTGGTSNSANTVICGLPLLSMSPGTVYRIMMESFDILSEGGEFRFFTYSPICPVPQTVRERLGLIDERIAFTVKNVPPAAVYKLCRPN